MAIFENITASNVDEFVVAVKGFARRKGWAAGAAWLAKMNPECSRHIEMEMCSTGGGYTGRRAKMIVRGEFDSQPLPGPCPDKDCPGVLWYRATASVMKCCVCGELDLEYDYTSLADALADEDARMAS